MHIAKQFDYGFCVDEALGDLFISWDPPHPKRLDKPLFLYGKGKLGRLALDYLKSVGKQADGVFEGDEVCGTGGQVAICIVTSPYVPIEQKLSTRGFDDVAPFYDLFDKFSDAHPLINGWFAEQFTDNDLGKIEAVLERWDDDPSCAHYLQFLAWRRLREEWVFTDAPILDGSSRPFIPEIVSVLHDHERFLDGGAYRGEVSREFSQLVQGEYDDILAVEPDADNAERITVSTPLVAALAESDDVGGFYAGFDYCSRLGVGGQTTVQTATIDSLGFNPTIIKLHLEGGELNALIGARQILTACRPILAISLEHNADGLWRTADYVMNLLEDYTFLFRNHCWCGASAMLYGIPNERNK